MSTTTANDPSTPDDAGTEPAQAKKVLLALILVAAVANLNLSVANVALPDIGKAFDSSQTMLDLIAVGYSLGLAASVLWFGAIGDRYGRKMMIIWGMALSIVASVAAGLAPSDTFLFGARVLGGLSAGMAFPTTLALITALWTGPARTKSIALWSALGGGFAMLGPVLSGFLLEHFDWGSVFFITLPLVAIALPMAMKFVPAHINETTEKVDNLGGVLSAAFIGTLIVAINFLPVPNLKSTALILLGVALVAAALFVLRQRRAENPIYDLKVAGRSTFWVAGLGGIIVFGSLMGVAYIGQQYMQNVLGYSTLGAGAAILPVVLVMPLVAPRSATLVEARGSRFTLLFGQSFLLLAFIFMLAFWDEGISYALVAIPFVLVAIGVGLAGTPSSNSLTGSVPVKRVGMASGTADLQRDLGGALMTSIFGALLTAGYASAVGSAISASGKNVTESTQSQLQLSYASAEKVASENPQYSKQIIAGAQQSFVDGDKWAFAAACVAVILGMAIVARFFPKHEREKELRAQYLAESQAEASVPAA